MTDDGRLLKVEEVAALLRTEPSTVRRKIRGGHLVATKPCGQYLVSEGEVRRFLERSRVRAASPPRPPATSSAPVMPAPPQGRAPGGSFRGRRGREAA